MTMNSLHKSDWKEIHLGDIISLLTDYTANGSFASLKENVTYYNTPNFAVLVRTTDLDKPSFKPERYTDTRGYKYLRKTALHGGEIILANVGSVGKVFKVPYYNMPMTLAPNTYLIKFSGNTNSDYIFYWLNSEDFNRKLLSIIGSTTLQAINKDNLRSLNLIIPKDKLEQEKIASILSTIDETIEQTELLISKYKSIKQGLMQDLFKFGIDEKGQIRSEETHRFKDSPLGRIPEEWNFSSIGSSYLKGRIGWQGLTTKEYLDDGQYLLVTGTDFDNGKVKWDTCHYVEEKRYSQDSKIQLQEKDILVTKDGTIGKVAFVANIPLPATLNSGVFVIRPLNGEYVQKYLYYVLRSFVFDRFIENLSAGSTIKHLYQKDFVKFEFPLPDKPEQEKIISILEAQDTTIEFETKNLQKLHHIKAGLMQDLLTGKVRVNHLLN